MVTEQDKVYIQQAKATADKSVMIDKICRFLYAMLAMWSCWLFYSDIDNSNVFNSPPIMFVFVAFTFIQTVRRLLGDVDTSHYQELVAFVEAKLAENEVGSEKDSDLNADQSAEQAGQIPI
jgi:hypothetical protein